MRPAATCVAVLLTFSASAMAQTSDAAPADGAKLFRNQCAACHTLKADEPQRQGPTLAHVFERKIGAIDGYKYTAGYRESTEKWTAENLDKYLTNPQTMFPGSTMAYRQNKAETRKIIIDYLKEQG